MNPPKGPSDPRPNNEPYYIQKTCPKCGTKLVLHDSLAQPPTPTEDVWHDEFECPKCRDGIFMDWPVKELERFDRLRRGSSSTPYKPLDKT